MKRTPALYSCTLYRSVSLFYKKSVFFFSILSILQIVHLSCRAQESPRFRFYNYSSEDLKVVKGISQNTVNCILQDKRGFVWIGTWDGLNRFDGLNFVFYSPGVKDNEQNLGSQTIICLYDDDEGNLWAGTEMGLAYLNRKTQHFHKYSANYNNSKGLNCDTINCIIKDHQGLLWLGTANGINVFNKLTGDFTHFTRSNSALSSDTIYTLLQDVSGLIWMGTNNGLNCYNPKTKIFKTYFHSDTDSNSISDNIIFSLIQDKNKDIWVGTSYGLNRFNKSNNIFTNFVNYSEKGKMINNNIITSILEDHTGRMWIGTYGGGLKLFNKKTKSFSSYNNNPSDSKSLTNNFINCLYEDHSGIIWIGNAYKGVDKIDPNFFSFDLYRHIPYYQNSLCNNTVWSAYEDENGLLWIGTAGGLSIWNRKKNYWMQLVNEPGNIRAFSSNNIRSIFKDKEGIMWFGTDDAGVDRFNPKTGDIENYSNNSENKNYLCDNTVWNIFQDNSGFIWLATSNGLAKYNPSIKAFTFYKNNPINSSSLSNNLIYHIFQDSKNNLWISTNNGLNKYNPAQDNFKVYKSNSQKGKSINNNTIFSVYEDLQGNLWICTMGGGLNKYDTKKDTFTYYTTKEGLPNNVVYAVLPDNSGNFWLNTNHGLCRFNPKNESCINYDVKDGLQSYEFNGGAQRKLRSGELFFGGMNGFNLFLPEEIPERKMPPPPVITGVRVFNELNYREFYNGDTIILSYSDNFFSFEFASLDLSNGSNLFYEFKLDNINSSWIKTDADHRMSEYTNIDPGTYHFKVRASSTNDFSKSKITSIVLIITPPWWKTWIFRILLALTIITISILYIRALLKRIRKKNEYEKAMLDMEKKIFDTERKALRLQMNPHFIFNTLNAIQFFIFQNDKLSANKYISMFSKLIRQILINSQQNTILLKDDLVALELYVELELLRFENMFDFKIKVLPDDSILEYHIPSMILQPYVENAIRHGLIHRKEKGLLQITVKKEIAGRILCIIEDNGIGRDKAEEIRQKTKPDHQSMGIQITESRLRLINKLYGSEMFISTFDLKDDQGHASGTRVELNIPVMEKQ